MQINFQCLINRFIQQCNNVKHEQLPAQPHRHDTSDIRPLYIVTPTYTRATQLADLTRLANTLRLVPGMYMSTGCPKQAPFKPYKEVLQLNFIRDTLYIMD